MEPKRANTSPDIPTVGVSDRQNGGMVTAIMYARINLNSDMS